MSNDPYRSKEEILASETPDSNGNYTNEAIDRMQQKVREAKLSAAEEQRIKDDLSIPDYNQWG